MLEKITVKPTILVVDDCALNREMLAEILAQDYRLLNAASGVEAIDILREHSTSISLVLLDVVMPEMDGFQVLETMGLAGWREHIPVMMMSADTSMEYVRRAYAAGVVDFINRPMAPDIVKNRVANTLALHMKQVELETRVAEQAARLEEGNRLMISILSQIVEFRNGESGSHVVNVRAITQLLMHRVNGFLGNIYSAEDIYRICMASALHDIGKIDIPKVILNKPGRYTESEFELMKRHTIVGAEMLDELMENYDDPMLKVAREICLSHHERFDGKGYPNGLVGNSIPISAQVVSVADCYDALRSKRCYKEPHDHETALNMILSGECGAFSPLMLRCLQDVESEVKALYEIGKISYKKAVGSRNA